MSQKPLVVLAAGLSSSWQQTVLVDGLRLGEVNRLVSASWCASGKVLNVAMGLHRLLQAGWLPPSEKRRGEVVSLSMRGGTYGELMARDVAGMGLRAEWIESDAPTRVCTTVIDRATAQATELVENARTVSHTELDAYAAAFEREARQADWLVFSGSLPTGTPPDYLTKLLELAPGVRSILDVRGPDLIGALGTQPFLVKPNREELCQTAGQSLPTDGDLLAAMRHLNHRGARWVLVTQGCGPLWLTSRDETWTAAPLVVPTVNPIGCGDCLAAGLAWGLASGLPPHEALRFGLAAAAENAADLLPARLDPVQIKSRAMQAVVARIA